MSPERWQKVKELFDEARRKPANERDSYLSEQCAGDTEMITVIKRMIEEDERTGMLDRPPLASGPASTGVFAAGQLIAGRYRVIRFLNRGGMGEVYEVEDVDLKQLVALKTLLPAIAADGRMIARFKQEIQLSRQVSHENVCRVFDLARHQPEGSGAEPLYFLTMEFLPGQTLAERLSDGRRLSCAEALPLLEAMASALDAAHRAGVIHRDFKPSNVMLSPGRNGTRVVVTDFGLSRRIFPDHDATVTASGAVMGTLDYMAPELLTGSTANTSSDVYALATVAYKMVSGKLPFPNETPLAGAILRSKLPLPSPREHVPDLDPRWERAILRGIDPEPARRPASAGEFVKSLRGETATVSLPLPVMTRRRWAAAALATVLLLGGWVGWRRWTSYRGQPSPEARRWYELGAAALRDGTYYRAAKALDQAIFLEPGFPLAHARLAEARNELDDSEKAKEEMLVALEAPYLRDAPHSIEALYVDAIHRMLAGDYAGAIRAYTELEGRVPAGDKSAVLVDLGRARQSNEEPDKAMEAYRGAIKLDPQNAAAHLRAGILLGRLAKYADANAEFDRAAALYQASTNNEGQAEVLYQQALVATAARKFGDARAALEKALALARAISTESQEIADLLQMSVVTYLDGSADEAERIATAATEKARRGGMTNLAARGLTDLGSAQSVKGDLPRAEANFRDALELAQRYRARRYEARAQLSLASLHQRKGDLEAALREAESALEFYQKAGFPVQTRQAVFLIARTYRDRGKESEALSAFEQLLAKATTANDRVQMAVAEQGIASVQLLQERWPEALDHFQRFGEIAAAAGYADGIMLSPEGRGGVLWKLGRYQDADQAFKDAVKAAGNGAAASHMEALVASRRGEMALSRGLYREAVAFAKRAIALDTSPSRKPSTDDCVEGLAMAYAGAAREGEQLCRNALAAVEGNGDRAELQTLRLMLAEVLLAGGRFPDAAEQARAAAAEFETMGHRESAWRGWAVTAVAAKRAGDPAAGQAVDRANARLAELEPLWGAGNYQSYLTRPDIRRLQAELAQTAKSPKKSLH